MLGEDSRIPNSRFLRRTCEYIGCPGGVYADPKPTTCELETYLVAALQPSIYHTTVSIAWGSMSWMSLQNEGPFLGRRVNWGPCLGYPH